MTTILSLNGLNFIISNVGDSRCNDLYQWEYLYQGNDIRSNAIRKRRPSTHQENGRCRLIRRSAWGPKDNSWIMNGGESSSYLIKGRVGKFPGYTLTRIGDSVGLSQGHSWSRDESLWKKQQRQGGYYWILRNLLMYFKEVTTIS